VRLNVADVAFLENRRRERSYWRLSDLLGGSMAELAATVANAAARDAGNTHTQVW
jgi:hypothetical protein